MKAAPCTTCTGKKKMKIGRAFLANADYSCLFSFLSCNQYRDDHLCRIALVGITAGGVGLDLSPASIGIFIELPYSPSWLRQAEDR